MELITTFLGRFHPLLVHLPIGILTLAFLFECLSFWGKRKTLKKAIQPALFWGAVSSIAAGITGYFLRQEGGYEEVLANRHQNSGIITAVLALVVYVLRPKVKHWVDRPITRRRIKLGLSAILMVSLVVTGHWGGSLTHGDDYLFAAVSGNLAESKDPAEEIRKIGDAEDAIMYDHIIQPILEARCFDCHSSRKQKGDLRLDGQEFIHRGGESGRVIHAGSADSSTLFQRLVLPQEDEDHMPPNEKPQLSSSEIALIQYWIDGGADFEKRVAAFPYKDRISDIIFSMQRAPEEFWLPAEPVSEAKANSVQRLKELGINPMLVAEGNNYLMVSFSGHKEVTAEQLNQLREIEDQLVWLNLSFTGVSDQDMETISHLSNLRVLYLNNTLVTDAGMLKLSTLQELRMLSIVGTKATDRSVPALVQMKQLKKLFLFQSGMSSAGIRTVMDAHENIEVDTGNYKLQNLATDTIVYKKVADPGQ